MFGLTITDIFVIIFYFTAMIGIGIWAMKRISNQEDFFLGGRKFGKIIQTFAFFGQGTSADTSVSVTTTTMANGASGVWSSLNILWATPMYWIISPWYRRMRVMTIGDFFEERYGSKKLAATYAIIGSLGLMLLLSLGFNAMSKTILAMTPKSVEQLSQNELAEYKSACELKRLETLDYSSLSDIEKSKLEQLRLENPKMHFSHLNAGILILIVCIVVFIYSVLGGLEAAFLTDLIQGVFIIILSVVFIPFAFMKINLMHGTNGIVSPFKILHYNLPDSFFQIFGSPTAIDFTWYYIAALSVMVAINVAVQANQMTASGSAKDEFTARIGFVSGSYMKRVVTILWGVFALFAILLYGDSLRDPDLIWGIATVDLLGPLNIGLVGLMVACLMAALMSTADCLMLTNSSLLTRNLYYPLFPGKSEKHYVAVGRIFGAIVIIGTAILAIQFQTLLEQMKLIWEFHVIFAAAFWMGVLWRRSNLYGAWISIVFSLMLFFIIPIIIPVLYPQIKTDPFATVMTEQKPVSRIYTAKIMDVEQREKEIEIWKNHVSEGKTVEPSPLPLTMGMKFEKTYLLPARPVFWSKDVKMNQSGQMEGSGRFNFDLYLIYLLGFDLSKNPNALNETIRILLRITIPFFLIIITGYLTKQNNDKELNRFYVKMKTPVNPSREKDLIELEKSYESPNRFDHVKMFPKTCWEMTKWDKTDIIGFLIVTAAAILIVGIFFLVLLIGK